MGKENTCIENSTAAPPPPPRDYRFKLTLLCLCLILFLSAIEFISVSTALPTIISDLHGDQFLWVTSSYALSSAAIIPLIGNMAEMFGRKPTTLLVILCFGLGSAICGAAHELNTLIFGRVVQGLGGGAIVVMTNIVLADTVPLQERGGYGAFFSLTWCLAAVVGPMIGGGVAQSGQWRWLFLFNIPICIVSFALAALFMNLPTPPGSFKSKLARVDWLGNVIIIGSSVAITFALTDGGINFSWSSPHILAPLILGLLGLVAFFVYESALTPYPLVPFNILNNRSSISGYIQTFLSSVTTVTVIYYIPVYFQGVQVKKPFISGVLALGLSSIAVFAILGGISVKVYRIYRPQIWFGWVMQIIGAGLLISIKHDNAKVIGFCIVFGTGAGINYSTQYYPIQSSLPIETSAQALAFHGFLRSFSAIWGVTLGGAILQNYLALHLPEEIVSQSGASTGLLYPIIPRIGSFPEPLQATVRQAFLSGLRPVWVAVATLSAAGLLSSLIMQDVPMHIYTDKKWDPVASSPLTPSPSKQLGTGVRVPILE